MKSRGQKLKIDNNADSKQATTKKGKKNGQSIPQNQTSTNQNHKYRAEYQTIESKIEPATISVKQFLAVARTLAKYCDVGKGKKSKITCQKGQLASKLYYYLHKAFRIEGKRQDIQKIQSYLLDYLPQSQTLCQQCSTGNDCESNHLKYLQNQLPEQIARLQKRLQQLQQEQIFFKKIASTREKLNPKQNTLQELQQILELQQQVLNQLQQTSSENSQRQNPLKKRKFAKLQILIDDE